LIAEAFLCPLTNGEFSNRIEENSLTGPTPKPDNYRNLQKQAIRKLIEMAQDDSAVSRIPMRPDYESDRAVCLTSVVAIPIPVAQEIERQIIQPLRAIEPVHHYYAPEAMHLTIKNVQVVHDPPSFSEADIERVNRLFAEIIPRRRVFAFSLEQVVAFATSLSLIGYCGHELQELVQALDSGLKRIGIPDNKKYISDSVFFGNITLCRFVRPPSEQFLQAVRERQDAYRAELRVKEIRLISCNAVCARDSLHVWHTYRLRADESLTPWK
jgi:2'-5' RNA ligase